VTCLSSFRYYQERQNVKSKIWFDFWCLTPLSTIFNSYIMATSFSGGRSRSTRREPPTMGKQLVNFITCGCESSAPGANPRRIGDRLVWAVRSNDLTHWATRAREIEEDVFKKQTKRPWEYNSCQIYLAFTYILYETMRSNLAMITRIT
jgi:hypothetical protein